ncbi:MAG: hypothetical protein WAM71_15880 [Candidatus Korobacteraceae bacterium]
MRKILISLLIVIPCLICGISMSAQNDNVLRNPQVSVGTLAITPPLRDMVKNRPTELHFGYHVAAPVRYPKQNLALNSTHIYPNFKDTAAQTENAPASIPVDELDWLGIGLGFFGYSVADAPSDANLAIGDTQIVQWVNVQLAVFDLNGNNILFGGQPYVDGSVLFSGLPDCGKSNSGDIIAQWDKIAHVWVMYQPVLTAPYYDCFAVSLTNDATGAYKTYEFPTYDNMNDFPDYPKVGIWANGYYVSHNSFYHLQSYNGVMPCAYDRAKMLAGRYYPNGVCFLDNSNGTLFDDSLLPADIDDASTLPNGLDPIFMGSVDNGQNGIDSHVYYYPFHFDTVTPTNSTFGCVNGACPIPVTQYQVACQDLTNGVCTATQPIGVLNNTGDRLMYRLAYRILPAPTPAKDLLHDNRKQEWLVSHTVFNGSSSAVRWYEFRSPIRTNTPTTFQQGTYAPDSNNRFMSSMSRDKTGNIAMSYTVSGATVAPTIAFTGRGPGDSLGTMGAETILVPGGGSQLDTGNQWGSYYDIALSNDGCTFVTTGQYYQSDASFAWSTRIGKLKFSSCTPSN